MNLNNFNRGYFTGAIAMLIMWMTMLVFRYDESLLQVLSFGIGVLIPVIFFVFLILYDYRIYNLYFNSKEGGTK